MPCFTFRSLCTTLALLTPLIFVPQQQTLATDINIIQQEARTTPSTASANTAGARIPASAGPHSAHDPNVARGKLLTKAPEFPDVPPFKGKDLKFIDGLYHPLLRNGQKCYQAHYRTRDDAQSVRDWYKSALLANGWKLENQQKENVMLAARKLDQGLIFFLVARDLKQSDYHCEFFIRYLITPPLPSPH